MVDDTRYMRLALWHAARGEGRTTPNPMVGAVLVSPEGVIVGHGWHERAGEPHAEINAIQDAAGLARGSTLYVTLEPCCHTGRTPPCTPAIIEAGITRVVAAMRDPDPRVCGRGLAQLHQAGIAVESDVCRDEAERLNRAFILTKTEGRPLVVLKAATSLDARMAAAPGERTILTGAEANRKTHVLRARVDAIGVGSTTILVDDPLLTARECYRLRPLLRVIFDGRLRTPPSARVFSTLDAGPVLIMTSPSAMVDGADRAHALESAGARVTAIGGLSEALRTLLDWEVSTVLIEGGARLQAAFWTNHLVDRFHLVVAPRMLGADGVKLLDGHRFARADLSLTAVEPRGSDVWLEADVHRNR